MKIELPKEKFLILEEFFEKYIPDAKISSVIMDEALYNLGFSKHIPCIIELNLTEKQVDKAFDILFDLETYAVLSSEEPPDWWDPLLDNWHRKKQRKKKCMKDMAG